MQVQLKKKTRLETRVCDYISSAIYIVIVLTMCNLTISSILQTSGVHAYISLAYAVMKGLNRARAHLERVLSLHDSVD